MWEFVGLAVVGYVTGVVGFVTGMASIVSFPALLAFGLSPVAANATNTVSLIAIGVGATARAGEEIKGRGRELYEWIALSAVGGAVGAALLLIGSDAVFAAVVPFLVALGGVALLLQPRILALHDHRHAGIFTVVGLFAVSIYVGYFGAGGGVLFVALLLLTRAESIHSATVLKSFFLGIANLVAAIGFAFFAPVHWGVAAALALGALAGGWSGPPVAKLIPADVMRIGVGVGALGLAAWLFFR